MAMQTQIDNLYVTLDESHPLSVKAKTYGITISLSAHYLDFVKGDKIIRVSVRHLVYAGDIISSFDYYFSAVAPGEFNGGELVDYSTPRYHDVAGFNLMPVFFSSFCEPIVTTNQYLKFANLMPGHIVLDLGAYSGLTSIIFKELVGKAGIVVAVDADSENIKAIRTNLSLYKKLTGNSIDVIFGAAWNHCNGLSFSNEGNMGSSASEIVGNGRGRVDLVKSFTLTEICNIFKINSVDFIKCDIEGAESVVFEDEEFMKNNRPKIILETHIKDGIETTHKCVADLQRFGYTCRKIAQTGVELPLLECHPPPVE